MDHVAFDLELLPERYAVVRMPPDAPMPRDLPQGSFFSITRTKDELSLVVPELSVPADERSARGWRLFVFAGQIPFESIGVLRAIVDPLADANISVFIVSTFDTDFFMVREPSLEAAHAALTRAGHRIRIIPENG